VLTGAPDPSLPRLLPRLGGCVDITDMDHDAAAAALAPHRPDGIVSFVDDHLVTAAAIAARLGLSYHSPEVAVGLADKRRQRDLLARAGVAGPRFWSLGPGPPAAAFEEVPAAVTFPVVAKPAARSGSRGIRLATDRAQLAEVVAAGPTRGWVVEEYLEDACGMRSDFASYLSVESVLGSGEVSHVAITSRFPLASEFRETGNFIPVRLPPPLERSVLATPSDALAALGVTSAAAHTEIKLTPDGPRLIEVNGRPGGRPPFVLRAAAGVNLFALTCQAAAGIPVHVDGPVRCRAVGCWLMVQPPVTARRVGEIAGLEEISHLDGVDLVQVRRHPGEHVDWREGTDSQVLTVRGAVPDHPHLVCTIRAIHEALTVRYLTTA